MKAESAARKLESEMLRQRLERIEARLGAQ